MNKKELRTKFFEKHTVKDEHGIPKVVTHPHNLFEWMYEQLTLTDVGVSEEVCKHSDDKWIKDSGGDYFCLVCEGEIEA